MCGAGREDYPPEHGEFDRYLSMLGSLSLVILERVCELDFGDSCSLIMSPAVIKLGVI